MQKPAITDEGKRRRPKGGNGNGGANRRPNGSWSWRMTTADGRRLIGYPELFISGPYG